MKNILKVNKRALTILALIASFSSVAQDVKFSQAVYNPLTLNPAMMGLNPDLKTIMQYRNQWADIDKGFSTYAFTALMPVYINEGFNKLDFGLSVINDVAGAFNNLNVATAMGTNFRLSNLSYINLSLQGAFIQRTLDINSLTFDEQFVLGEYSADNQNTETNLNNKVTMADFSFGALWYTAPAKLNLGKTKKISMYTGVSVFHINTPPNETFAGGTGSLPRRYSIQGGIKIEGANIVDVTPNFIINSQEGNNNLAIGALVDFNFEKESKLTLGTWYRNKDAVSVSVGFEYNVFKLSYSYDVMATSQLSNSVSAAQTHEVTLILKFKNAMKPEDAMTIPSMF